MPGNAGCRLSLQPATYGYLGDMTAANLLTVSDLALHEGGGGQACADGITEAALGMQALAGPALAQRSGAQVHVLGWWLWTTGRSGQGS